MKLHGYVLFCILFLSSFTSSAVQIRFPEEELASESVLPLFNPSQTVLNRKITLKHQFEFGASASFGLDEPFYSPTYATGQFSFYFTEIHGLNFSGTYFFPFRSSIGEALSKGVGLEQGRTFNVWALPYPQMMGFLSYQYTPYYGKISLTKKGVLNLSIYGFAGPGVIIFNSGGKELAGTIGVGQKLYFSKWFALRGDIGFYGYYGPSPAKTNLNQKANDSIPYNALKPENKNFIINLVVSIGFVALI